VALGLEFGVNQLAVDFDLKPALRRRHQGKGLDLGFETFEQFRRQTGGSRGVVSDGAVGDGDV